MGAKNESCKMDRFKKYKDGGRIGRRRPRPAT